MSSIIARKILMSSIYSENGEITPVTVVEYKTARVVGKRSIEKDSYLSTILGFGKEGKKTTKAQYVFEFRDQDIDENTDLSTLFSEGDNIEVISTTKGKGFAGVVKRYGFRGQPSAHGSKSTRRPGSIGNLRSGPGSVKKGQKMPGRMGGKRKTLPSKIVKIDKENNLFFIKGSIPGSKDTIIRIQKI